MFKNINRGKVKLIEFELGGGPTASKMIDL